MSSAFVPTFKRVLTEDGKTEAWRLASQVINALLVVTGVLVLLGMVFAPPLVRLYAPEYAAVEGKMELTILLTRVTLPFLTLIALAAVFMGMLNAMRRFFIPALSPAMFNVLLILGAASSAWIGSRFGVQPIFALAIGFVLGGFGQMAVQWPLLRREGFRHQWVLNFRDSRLREVLMLMGPGTLGQAAAQINLFVNTLLATSQGTGAVTWLAFAFQLMYLPIGIFGVSVGTASTPDLAVYAGRQAWGDMRRVLSAGLRLMLMLSVPACAGLMVLAVPIVELTLESGAFTPDDTLAVAAALLGYAPGLMGYSIAKIATPAFYAMRDARTPVMVSAVTVVTNVILNITLVRIYGYVGLAVGTTIASTVNAALLLWLMSRRIGGLDGARIWRAFVKIAVASLVMAAAAYWTEAWLHAQFPDPTLLFRAVRVFGAIAVALGTLGLAATALRIEEFSLAMRGVLGRLRG
jgi:putative peptidoglycan lipid II flippase